VRRPRPGTPVSSIHSLLVAAALCVPVVIGVLYKTATPEAAQRVVLQSATGTLSITNSREGRAVLSARAMIPGRSATGTVTLINSGAGAEQLSLAAGPAHDRPGPGGGRLSQRLRLTVADVTEAAQDDALYSGSLTRLRRADLGAWRAGEQRTYRFTVAFLDSGGDGADNAFQGSSASVDFGWTATRAAD
jgi:spore coat-associated protein N